MGIDGDNSGDEWRAHRPECVCVGVVTTTTTIITTLLARKERRATWFFGLRESTDFFGACIPDCLFVSILFLAVHIRRDGARYDASCAIFDWILREIFSNPLPAKLLLCPTFGATCVCTYTHAYVNAWTVCLFQGN